MIAVFHGKLLPMGRSGQDQYSQLDKHTVKFLPVDLRKLWGLFLSLRDSASWDSKHLALLLH